MPSEIKIYHVKDFIRINESGALDADRSLKIVRQLAVTAAFHTDHNILIDMRDTRLDHYSMSELLSVSLEMASHKNLFKNRIASVIPNDEKRILIAKNFQASLDIKGFHYRFFTDFEDAIEWLSETTQLDTSSI